MRTSFSTALSLMFVAALLLGGCASSRNAVQTLSGTWDYTVYGTPEGNVGGELRLDVAGDALSGELTNELASGPSPLQNITLEDQPYGPTTVTSLSFSASLNIDGQRFDTATKATLNGDTLEGTIDVAGVGAYRFMAVRAGS